MKKVGLAIKLFCFPLCGALLFVAENFARVENNVLQCFTCFFAIDIRVFHHLKFKTVIKLTKFQSN